MKVNYEGKVRFYYSVPDWNEVRGLGKPVLPISKFPAGEDAASAVRFKRTKETIPPLVPEFSNFSPSSIIGLLVHCLNLGVLVGFSKFDEVVEELSQQFSKETLDWMVGVAIERSYYSSEVTRDSHVLLEMETRGFMASRPCFSNRELERLG